MKKEGNQGHQGRGKNTEPPTPPPGFIHLSPEKPPGFQPCWGGGPKHDAHVMPNADLREDSRKGWRKRGGSKVPWRKQRISAGGNSIQGLTWAIIKGVERSQCVGELGGPQGLPGVQGSLGRLYDEEVTYSWVQQEGNGVTYSHTGEKRTGACVESCTGKSWYSQHCREGSPGADKKCRSRAAPGEEKKGPCTLLLHWRDWESFLADEKEQLLTFWFLWLREAQLFS